MSRPGFSFIGFVTPLGALLALVLAASLPARAIAQAVAPQTKFEHFGSLGIQTSSLESHVIPAKAGIQFLPDRDPRFRGGDVLTFICMGGPLAHDRSLGPGR